MIVFPNAKINIGLNILRRRVDGFHDIESILYPIPFNDVLEAIEADSFELTESGIPVHGTPQSNLCTKAYHLLKKDFGISPVKIHLHKVIPMGAGLGGGSSDGAFSLKLLNDLFKLNISKGKLASYAAILGSDCPFFIYNCPAIATGTGTVINPIEVNLKGYEMCLVTPNLHVSTENAYGNVLPINNAGKLSGQIVEELPRWKDSISNQFEQSVFPLFPSLEKIKEALYKNGAIYASMTGSGAALYGIFEKRTDLNSIDAPVYWFTL